MIRITKKQKIKNKVEVRKKIKVEKKPKKRRKQQGKMKVMKTKIMQRKREKQVIQKLRVRF